MSSSIFFFFFFLLFAVSNAFNPWDAFLNLTDCRHGEANPVIHELKQYLHQFGYLSFDDNLELALKTYQQNFNLNATGILDLSIMQRISPYCGIPDIINSTSSTASGKCSGCHLYAYFLGNPSKLASPSANHLQDPATYKTFRRL